MANVCRFQVPGRFWSTTSLSTRDRSFKVVARRCSVMNSCRLWCDWLARCCMAQPVRTCSALYRLCICVIIHRLLICPSHRCGRPLHWLLPVGRRCPHFGDFNWMARATPMLLCTGISKPTNRECACMRVWMVYTYSAEWVAAELSGARS